MSQLLSKRRRSKLGPTRYIARCVSRIRVAKRPCWNMLPAQQHTGICMVCRELLLRVLQP